jgi:TolB-like protein
MWKKWRKTAMAAGAVLIIVVGTVLLWNFFRPALSTVEPASIENMTYPLPDKPSIAVLPFINMSDDPKLEYFSNGLTEDLITDLSSISGLFVVARNSTFAYKGKPVKIRQVAEELGVRYVLEGSVRRAEYKLRINAQLIDAITGHYLWAKRYDGQLVNVLSLQDKITQKIVTALALKLTEDEQGQVTHKDTDNIEAYDAYLKGREHYQRHTPDDYRKAVFFLKKAIELDPSYSGAYSMLALTYFWTGKSSFLVDGQAVTYYLRVRPLLKIAMKNPDSTAHSVASSLNVRRFHHEEAIEEAKRAIAIEPNNIYGHHAMAWSLIVAGRPEEAIYFANKALRLDPVFPGIGMYYLGLAHLCSGHYEEAVTFLERALKHNAKMFRCKLPLAAAYGHLGREKEARTALTEYLEILPYMNNLRRLMLWRYRFKPSTVADRFAEGLLKAGLHGESSGYYKIDEKYRLTGEEIGEFAAGTTTTGIGPTGQWWVFRSKDGKAILKWVANYYYSGLWWMEGEDECYQWQDIWGGLKHCGSIFRNPEGTREMKDEYFIAYDHVTIPFSRVD